MEARQARRKGPGTYPDPATFTTHKSAQKPMKSLTFSATPGASSRGRVRALRSLALLLLSSTALAAEPLHTTPRIETPDGQLLARGDHVETRDQGRIESRTTYVFPDGRVIEEELALTTNPLAQESLSLLEKNREGVTLRRFKADLRTGDARAFVDVKGEAKNWDEHFKVKPGRVFSGAGFVYAVQEIRREVKLGDSAWAQAVAFTPQPRLATVRITGENARLVLDGVPRDVERWVIHPEIGVLDIFVDAPDFILWLDPATGALLAFDGPIATPNDPKVRVITGG